MRKEKFVLQWHLTHKCNLRCKHCYQDDYKNDLSLEVCKNILLQFKNFIDKNNYKLHINFTGGEPFVEGNKEKLFKLMAACDVLGITYGILSNGTLITKEITKELKRCKNLKFVQMSLEGIPETNNSIRGENNYKEVMKAVKLLNKAKIETMISFTIHEGNYKELKKLIWKCRLNGVKRFWTDRLVPIGGIDEYQKNGLNLITTTHYKEVIDILEKELKLNWLGMKVHANRSLQFLTGSNESYKCNAGDKLLVILADGTLLPCRRLPIVFGNLINNTLEEILNSDNVKKFKEEISENNCKNCFWKEKCNGGAKCITYALKNSLKEKDVNCWHDYFFHEKI